MSSGSGSLVGSGSKGKEVGFSAEEVAELLRSLGLLVDTDSIVAIERFSSDTVRVIISKNGAAFHLWLSRDDKGGWRRTPIYPMR